MKSIWFIAIGVAALVLIIGAVLLLMPVVGPPPGLDQSRSRTTEKGLFAAAIEPEAPEIRQGELHSWIVTLKTPDGKAVEDAKIEIGGGMPQHEHGLPTAPQATAYLGDGRYRIEGVKFTMTGWWELRLDISSAAGSDVVVFNLVL